MLLREKYQPSNINDFDKNLSYYNNLSAIDNTIIYGRSGCGKFTFINLLLNNIYNSKSLRLTKSMTELKMNNSKNIEFNYYHSRIHHIINPTLYGLYDKIILAKFLSENTCSSNINKFFSTKNNHKIIIIMNAEHLSKNAQTLLKSLMENKDNNYKIIFLTNSIDKIHDSIVSKCHSIKINNNFNHTFDILKNIKNNENIDINDKKLEEIINVTNFNIKKSINLLEYYQIDNTDNINKLYQKLNDTYSNIRILMNIIYTQKIKNIIPIRDLVYNLLISFNKPLDILQYLYLILENDILKLDIQKKEYILLEINNYITNLVSMLSVANKPIIYIENFIYFLFDIFNKYNIKTDCLIVY